MITLYTRDNPPCSYCQRAKQLLKVRDIPYTEYKVGQDIVTEDLRSLFPSAKTLPVIVAGGVYIGGYDQLVQYLTEQQPTEDNMILG